MKKRLLSATLALAMVLTLLPFGAMPAFAAAGESVTYHESAASTTTVYKQTDGTTDYVWTAGPAWFKGSGTAAAPYVAVSGGVIASTGNFNQQTGEMTAVTSGSWYGTVTHALVNGVTSMTLNADVSASGTGKLETDKTTLTIDLHGHTITDGVNLVRGGTLTIGNSGAAASVDAVTVSNVIADTSATINIGKGVTVSTSVTTKTGVANTLNVINGVVTPQVTMNGKTATTEAAQTVNVTGTSAKITGGLVISGGKDCKVTVSGGGFIGGTSVTQTSGSNTVSVSGTGSNGGTVTVTQTTGGSVSVTDYATAGTVTLASTKGTGADPTITVDSGAAVWNIVAKGDSMKVNVNNAGKVSKNDGAAGDVKLIGRTDALTADQKTSLIAPSLMVNGGTISGSVTQETGTEQLEKDYTVTVQGGGTVTGRITLPRAQVSVDQATVTGGVDMKSGTLTVKDKATLGTVVLGDMSGLTYPGARAVMNVTGFGNTVGAISQATGNTNKIALTIIGVTQDGQNPKDNDTNRFAGISVGNWGNWDAANSSVAGGHFKVGLKGNGLLLLPKYIAYQVEETNGTYGDYKYSYWADTEKLMNTLATMTGTIHEIISKGAIDGTSGGPVAGSPTITLFMYDPRSVGDGDPATNPALPSGKAKPLFAIHFPANMLGNSFTLPSVVGSNKSITWYPLVLPTTPDANGTISPVINTMGTPIAGGKPVTPSTECAYVSNDISYKVTKVLNVQVASQVNPTVKAKLVGGNVVLSGLAQIYGMANSAVIPLELETDAIEKVTVNAVWNPKTKALSFSDGTPTVSAQTGGALVIAADDNSYLRLVESNTKVGLRAENLNEYTLTVNIKGNTTGSKGGMVTTTTRIPNTQVNGDVLKKQLAEALTKPAGADGPVDFSASPTVQQEFGAYIAKLNQSTLNSLLKKVQQDKYKVLHPEVTQTQLNNLTQAQLDEAGYTSGTIDVVLYMNVDITSFNRGASNYTMTATMTPYARVEVHSTRFGEDNEKFAPVVIVNGTSLGTLDSGNPGEVKVTMPDVSSVFAGLTKAANYARQNNTYVGAVDSTTRTFSLLHTAANGAGFGTVVLDDKLPLAEVQKQKIGGGAWENYAPTRKLYDTVQAAVDDAKNGEKVLVNDTSSGIVEYPISVTGRARTIYIDVTGNRKITKANNASDVIITQPTGNSTMYTVQLTKDNAVVKPTEKPIPISVTSATGGAASVSASRADEGDTITVTLTPATNYRVGGVTVTAAVKNSSTGVTTNTTVATTAASANSWRFVVPTGATSVTVTPSFVATSTGATVTVSSATGGTATTSAGTNRVAPGSTVSVTTVPSSGYRTMGLVVTSNTGSATATRTGVNSYVFTVPAGSTNVVVTPRFDVNNGTVFEDVWSTEYFSSAVAWAVGRGVTNGTDTYHFSPYNNCTRADMVTFLYRAAGSPAVGNVANPFWDVQPGSYYYNAVLWAVSKGITNGVSANQFGVNQIVTRAQAVTFLHRYNGSPAPASGNRFYDVPAREYYANAVAWATGKGVTNGTSTTLFSPNQAVTRAQAVAFLYRDFNNVRA